MNAGTAIVSKCLMGHPCQHDGTAADRQLEPWMIERLGCRIVEVCPEETAGFGTPRKRMELVGGDGRDVLAGSAKVQTKDGEDRTEAMLDGATAALRLARQHNVSQMIARRRSPSCSCGMIADGSFSGRLVEGIGVTTALLRSELAIPVVELEDIVSEIFAETLRTGLWIYQAEGDWTGKRTKFTSLLRERMPLAALDAWRGILLDGFRGMIREFHDPATGDAATYSDSDTVRFFQEALRDAWALDPIDPMRRCRVCTYPEGFLDCHLGPDGICSACTLYRENREPLTDLPALRAILRGKLADVRGKFSHDAVAACSGGKDSTYMLYKLCRDYQADVLCVMDDLDQQDDEAVENLRQVTGRLNVACKSLGAPPETLAVRRNFLLRGNSFCRLCLRSHLIRVYQLALEERIPLVFFGLSPYQCLDCTDSIRWSLNAVRDAATPLRQLDCRSVLQRYKHRAFQGGFDVGFITDQEKALYNRWTQVFDGAPSDFAPLVVPFFLFDGYPGEKAIIDTIVREIGWKRRTVLLDRTNCRLLRLAGILHRAVGRHHMNYKERATRLRVEGKLLSEHDSCRLGIELDQPGEAEGMTREEFERVIKSEFRLSVDDLPSHVRNRLNEVLQ